MLRRARPGADAGSIPNADAAPPIVNAIDPAAAVPVGRVLPVGPRRAEWITWTLSRDLPGAASASTPSSARSTGSRRSLGRCGRARPVARGSGVVVAIADFRGSPDAEAAAVLTRRAALYSAGRPAGTERCAGAMVGLAFLAVVAAACAEDNPSRSTTGATAAVGHRRDPPIRQRTARPRNAGDAQQPDGALTIGTGNPAYSRGAEGGTSDGSPSGSPTTRHKGDGYEAAFGLGARRRASASRDQVEFGRRRFNKSFAPGPKDFDFGIQQISYQARAGTGRGLQRGLFRREPGAHRERGVTRSIGATTMAELKDAKLGAPVGTTSLK